MEEYAPKKCQIHQIQNGQLVAIIDLNVWYLAKRAR